MSVDAQIQLLNNRKMSTDEDTQRVLLRHGYYAIINGYKDPFLDKRQSKAKGEDVYKKGTTFNQLYNLYKYDVRLRNLSLLYIAEIESIIKTALAYVFSKNHQEDWAYLNPENFSNDREANLLNLIGILKDRSQDSSYVGNDVLHYRENHSCVPLWVLSNSLTLGNIWHFYNHLKLSDKNEVCKHIATNAGHGTYLDPIKIQDSIEIILKFRNACAHNERLYCKKLGKQNSIGYANLISATSLFLQQEEFVDFAVKVINDTLQYRVTDNEMFLHVAREINLNRIMHLAGTSPGSL